MKKALLLSMVMIFMVIAAACGTSNKTDEGKAHNVANSPSESSSANRSASAESPAADEGANKRIVFVSPLIGHPVWLIAKQGFDVAAKDFGFEGSWVGPSNLSVEEMISAIETAIASKADGIISMALNASTMEPVIKKAADAKIPLILVNSDAPNTARSAYFGSTQKVIGEVAAEGIAKKLGGKGNVAIMTGALDAENLNATIKAFKELLAQKYPDIKNVGMVADNSDMTQALQQAEALFTTYPDLNAVFAAEANGAIALGNVIKEKGMTGKVTVIGMDDLDETLQLIRDGAVHGTIPQNFYAMGYLGAKAILDLKEGKEVPSVTDTGSILVTKDNIDSYKTQMTDFIKGK